MWCEGSQPCWPESEVGLGRAGALDRKAKTELVEDASQGFQLGVALLGEGAVEGLPAELGVVGELGDGEALGFCNESEGR